MTSQLFNIRCDNCGSEYRITTRGEMNCPFCGSKIYLNDKDFEAFKKARDEMLLKDREANDVANYEGDVLRKWNNEQQVFFETEAGKSINCKYCYVTIGLQQTIYVGSHHITILYKSNNPIDQIIQNVNSIKYPTADIKDLKQFLPNIMLTAKLKNNEALLVLSKPENVYPLTMTGGLDPKHVAWMISRMENLGCLLEFNSMDISQVGLADFYFNPKAHYIHLLGGWEYLTPGSPRNYLKAIREIALQLMNTSAAPRLCLDFLNKAPAPTAYDDFADWNYVINNGFSGHNFTQFPGMTY